VAVVALLARLEVVPPAIGNPAAASGSRHATPPAAAPRWHGRGGNWRSRRRERRRCHSRAESHLRAPGRPTRCAWHSGRPPVQTVQSTEVDAPVVWQLLQEIAREVHCAAPRAWTSPSATGKKTWLKFVAGSTIRVAAQAARRVGWDGGESAGERAWRRPWSTASL